MTLVSISAWKNSPVISASFGGAANPAGSAAALTRMSIGAAELPHGLGHGRPHLLVAGGVGADADHLAPGLRRQFGGRGGERLRVARQQRHVGAFLRQHARDGLADAAAAAGDERALALEFEVHGVRVGVAMPHLSDGAAPSLRARAQPHQRGVMRAVVYNSASGTTRPCNGAMRSTFSFRRSMLAIRLTLFALATAGGGVLGASGV